MRKVKTSSRQGQTRISSKNQARLPVEALRKAGLKVGDELRVEAAGAGRLVLVRADDIVKRHAGSLAGVFAKGYLERLRREWR